MKTISESSSILIKDTLKENIEKYEMKHDAHKKNEVYLKYLYYSLGVISLILSAIASFISGLLTIEGENKLINITLVLSIFISILNGILNFSKFESKIAMHHSDAGQYSHLISDIKSFMLDRNTSYEDKLNYERVILERSKLIQDYELDLCF